MEQSSGEPLTKCPICRYDLTGLPANHRCQECAFEYDETTRVWHTNDRRWLRCCSACAPMSLVTVYAFRAAADIVSGGRGFELVDWFLIGAVGLAVFLSVKITRSLDQCVVLGSRGVHLVFGRGRMRFIPWTELELRGEGPPEKRSLAGRTGIVGLPVELMKPERREGLQRAICDFAARYGVANPDIPRLPEWRWPERKEPS